MGGERGGEAALPGALPADGHGQGRLRLGGGDQERLPADRTAPEHPRTHLVRQACNVDIKCTRYRTRLHLI